VPVAGTAPTDLSGALERLWELAAALGTLLPALRRAVDQLIQGGGAAGAVVVPIPVPIVGSGLRFVPG
jgi:hypothetical protein